MFTKFNLRGGVSCMPAAQLLLLLLLEHVRMLTYMNYHSVLLKVFSKMYAKNNLYEKLRLGI